VHILPLSCLLIHRHPPPAAPTTLPHELIDRTMNKQSASGPTVHSSSELAAPAAAAPSGSIAQRCHTDALHCIFAFLDRPQLLARAAVMPQLAGCRQPRTFHQVGLHRGVDRLVAPSSCRRSGQQCGAQLG